MDCRESEQLIMAEVDGELDASAIAHLRAHLATCAACSAARAALKGLRAALKQQTTVHVAPTELRQRVALLARQTMRTMPVRRRLAGGLPWAWINFGAVAVFSAVFASMLLFHPSAPNATEQLEQEIVSSHFRSLMVDHLTDIASSDQHTVKPWFSGKLDFSPPVFDLAAQGFALIGARLDYLDGRTVAALAYRRHKHVLNLFVWPSKSDATAPLHISSRQGYQIASWSAGGFRYEAISDMNVHEFEEFKRQLELQLKQGNT